MDLYLLKYNNYYNRIVKREESLTGYNTYLCKYNGASVDEFGNSNVVQTTNFNPQDGINATHTVNWNGDAPDYVVVVKDNEIVSRWFVTKATYIRGGQYQLDLHRDIMVDYMDEVFNSTAYIRRGNIPTNNPLIYNSENMQFNQIKVSEDLLYDKTKRPWIIGYVSPNAELAEATIEFSGDNAPLTNYDEILAYSQTNLKVITSIPYVECYTTSPRYSGYVPANSKYYQYTYHITPNNPTTIVASGSVGMGGVKSFHQTINESGPVADKFTSVFSGKEQELKGYITSYFSDTKENNIYQQYNGKIVRNQATNKYYKITVSQVSTEAKKYLTRGTDASTNALFENIKNLIIKNDYITYNAVGAYNLYVGYNVTEYKLSLEETSYGDLSVSFTSAKRILQDAPYHMFAIPYTEQNYQLAMAINTANGAQAGGKIYDIQVLPYCPVQDYYSATGNPQIGGLVQHKDYEFINNTSIQPGENYTNILFWCTKSVFTFDIPYSVAVNNIKTDCECDLYRICSPNGNGTFEFNVAKNGGVSFINVDCTYRPYDPYIHLNPNFNLLYGKDYNDFRGLVLNGDFSIPALNDKWVQYTINNKNYQNIFNREIQSLELQNKYARTNDIWSAIAGAFGAGASSGGAGLMLGGPIGGIAGGLGGGLISGLAGIYDVRANEALRQEQLSLKKDLFKYSLQNIQALPQSISKTGCLTNNNKLVPYVEKYTCTDEEKKTLQDKIKYTGMALGVVGKIGDYVSTGSGVADAKYIEADLMEIPLNENYAIIMEIANLLSEGIRFA